MGGKNAELPGGKSYPDTLRGNDLGNDGSSGVGVLIKVGCGGCGFVMVVVLWVLVEK